MGFCIEKDEAYVCDENIIVPITGFLAAHESFQDAFIF